MSTPLRYLENAVNWVLLTFLPISFKANVHPDNSGHRTCYVLLYKDDTNFRETKAFFPHEFDALVSIFGNRWLYTSNLITALV